MARPAVDGIERDLKDQVPVVRLNVRENVGATLASRLGVRGVPTLIVWQDGERLRLVGRINRSAVVQAATP